MCVQRGKCKGMGGDWRMGRRTLGWVSMHCQASARTSISRSERVGLVDIVVVVGGVGEWW